jgi:hypothetical protein
MAPQHLIDALDASQTPPDPQLSANRTKAPARRNGQALARRLRLDSGQGGDSKV